MALPSFSVGTHSFKLPIIQGGMGIGISNYLLAGTTSKEGGLGVLSSAALDRVVSSRVGKKYNTREAAAKEVRDAKEIANSAPVGINIMVALNNHYVDSVLGALDGGVDIIISGAGLPFKLPEIVAQHARKDEVALVPIVSSARALKIIMSKWKKFNRTPDAVIVEGPLAGGHIGWYEEKEALSEENKLENLIKEILPICEAKDIPVIAAGGIFDHNDIKRVINQGCQAVQIGTRFVATHESGASQNFKNKLVDCTEEDIHLAKTPGSPCKLLFRVLKTCPFYEQAVNNLRIPKCDKGYIMNGGKCDAFKNAENSFCICNGLLASTNYDSEEKELHTVGSRAAQVNKIVSVKDLMVELSTEC